MNRAYRETRRLSPSALRALCIRQEWYTRGNNDEYGHLLLDLAGSNRCVRLQDRNGHFYDARKNPYCGYITLGKDTMCGLFDPWDGGGSVLEIQLEKEVRIPIRYIWAALPDGCGRGRYDVGDVYGMCASAWQDTLLKIVSPKNIDRTEVIAV